MSKEPRLQCRNAIGKLVVSVYKGDITLIYVDAIVNPANSYMVMGGGVAGVLKRRGGRVIEDEALKYAPVPVGEAVVTTAGRLKARYIIHTPTMERPAQPTTPYRVYLATKATLEKACSINSVASIAFPGMGTGVGSVDPLEASRSMVNAIREYAYRDCIKEILIVDINPVFTNAFCKVLEEQNSD